MSQVWDIIYGIDPVDESCPADEYLDGLSLGLQARFQAILNAVAAAPPPRFSGGGMWEAMHDDMNGYYEVRVDEGKKFHHRLFCKAVRNGAEAGLGGPAIFVITGRTKRYRTTFKRREYEAIREVAERMTRDVPWSFAT